MASSNEGYESSDMLVIGGSQQENEWILDSGCTYHMCPKRSWFSEYNQLSGGRVLMGNNNSCTVVGIGTIVIKLDDGTIYKLKQFRHVLELRKNLVSLGALDEVGFAKVEC